MPAIASGAAAQRLPWTEGDPPPSLAGIRLGDSRDAVERVLGKPDRSDEFGEDEWNLDYDRRGIEVQGSTNGTSAVLIGKRDSGDLDGIRAGDRAADAVKKWGAPTTGGLGAYVYVIGTWQVGVQEDDRGRIVVLALSRVPEAAAPAAEPPGLPVPAKPSALKGTLRDGTYTSPDGGLRFRLPLPAAPDTLVEEDIKKGGDVFVAVSAASLQLRFIFRCMTHPWPKSIEEVAAKEKFSGSVSEDWVQSRYGTALIRTAVLDHPEWGKQSRSGQIVVFHEGRSYEFSYHYFAPTPVVEPRLDGFTSLDQMLRTMFESLEIGGPAREKR